MKQIRHLTTPAILALAFLLSSSALAQHDHDNAGAASKQEPRHGDPYYLPNCPISGKRLGSMGDPVIKIYDGREIRFCCPACPPKFEKDRDTVLAKIDRQIIDDQLRLYPLKTSIVSGKDLPEKPLDFVYGNRLIRVVDLQEKERFLKEAERFLKDLNKAVVDQQQKTYPSSACLVSGEKLGREMGKPENTVMASRLIRLCCAHCKKDVEESPAMILSKLEAARAKGGAQEKPEQPGH